MSRFYNKEAEIVEQVQGKNGKMRAPHVGDVRKRLSSEDPLIPSVSTILKSIGDNDWLSEYKIKEALKRAFELIKTPDSTFIFNTEEEFIHYVMNQMSEHTESVFSTGHDIHGAIERFVKQGEVEPGKEKLIDNLSEMFTKFVGELYSEVPFVTPRISAEYSAIPLTHEAMMLKPSTYPFGGTIDLLVSPRGVNKDFVGNAVGVPTEKLELPCQIIDFKTVTKHPKAIYDSWLYQVSGYALGLSRDPKFAKHYQETGIRKDKYITPPYDGISEYRKLSAGIITISKEDMSCVYHHLSSEELEHGIKTFLGAVTLWYMKNKIL